MATSAPQPVPGRECGTCNVCCKIFWVNAPTLQKPAGTMCQHCSAAGCGIYETRPQACRDFFCLWRQVPTMPDHLRPDRIGVVFSIESLLFPQNPFEKQFVIARCVNSLADFDHPHARQALQVFIDRGNLPIWLSFEQGRRLFHPYPALRDAILSPTPPPPHLAPDVALWRQRLGI